MPGSLGAAVAVRFVGGLAAGGRDLAQVMVIELCHVQPLAVESLLHHPV